MAANFPTVFPGREGRHTRKPDLPRGGVLKTSQSNWELRHQFQEKGETLIRKLGLVAVVSLMVVLLGTSLAFGQRYEAKKAQGPIVIDGELSEWEGLPTIQITAEDGGLLTLMCQ